MSYDPKCYDLAEMFLEDSPKLDNERNVHRLAQVIQDAIESEIESMGWDYEESIKPENDPRLP